jgi:hypothetical protein
MGIPFREGEATIPGQWKSTTVMRGEGVDLSKNRFAYDFVCEDLPAIRLALAGGRGSYHTNPKRKRGNLPALACASG